MRGLEPRADRSIANSELCGDLSQAETLCLQLKNPFWVHRTYRTAQFLSVRLGIPNPGTNSLPDQISLKLRDG